MSADVPQIADRLASDQVTEVLRLAAAVAAHDGISALGETSLLALRDDRPEAPPGGAQTRHVLVDHGYAQIDPAGTCEFLVHPDHRGRGRGSAVLAAAIDAAASRFWAHGSLPAAAHLADRAHLEPSRLLYLYRLAVADHASPGHGDLPRGVTVRPFRTGIDEGPWLAVNSAAFAQLPDQGSWNEADLGQRIRSTWFHADDLLMAWAGDELAGFHWTRLDRATGRGEVYVIGLAPSWQGRGLGRALTLAGLDHLRAAGARTVELYADDTNTAALRMYERLGFRRALTDTQYAVASSPR